ncbi:hypothetical protein D1007_51669 [Hordeum vulgare]|nr:hypothetical protein D1007_51669 [Hordeum vulgare]
MRSCGRPSSLADNDRDGCAPPSPQECRHAPTGIQLSKREAAKEATTKAKAVRQAKEEGRLLRRLSGMRCSFDEDDDDDGAPPHVDTYSEEGHNRMDDRKAKGPVRKW